MSRRQNRMLVHKIKKQMFQILAEHGIKRGGKPLKHIEYIKMFCDIVGIEKPSKRGANLYLVSLYNDPTFEHIKKYVPLGPRKYLQSDWSKLRFRVFKRYGSLCMKCGYDGEYLQVDHIKPYSKYPELALEFDNLQILCRSCNASKGNRDETDYRKLA